MLTAVPTGDEPLADRVARRSAACGWDLAVAPDGARARAADRRTRSPRSGAGTRTAGSFAGSPPPVPSARTRRRGASHDGSECPTRRPRPARTSRARSRRSTRRSRADCEVIGELPDDLAGMFVRNGANPKYDPPGRYHWFDGDGMLHALHFENGTRDLPQPLRRAPRRSRPSTAAGHALWSGINERPDFAQPGGPFKDTANTDLVFHDGQLLALWWLGGPCYEIALPSLETVGRLRLPRHAARADRAPEARPRDRRADDLRLRPRAAVPHLRRRGRRRAAGPPHRRSTCRGRGCCTTWRSPSGTRS